MNNLAITRLHSIYLSSWLVLLCASGVQLPYNSCHAQFGNARQPDILAMYLFNGADEATFRKQLENRAQIRVTRIAEVVGLAPQQLEKLQFATRGDLSRFYRELEHVRQKTKGLDAQKQNDMQKAWEILAPLQHRIAQGIIGKDSLTDSILRSSLDEQQQTKYAEFQQQRQATQFRAFLRISVSDLEKSLPLTEKQRDELIKLVLGKELPKKAFAQPQMQAYLGFVMLARLTDDELGDLLDKQQLLTFRKLTAQYIDMLGRLR